MLLLITLYLSFMFWNWSYKNAMIFILYSKKVPIGTLRGEE